MDRIEFVFEGNPIAKKRPRFARRGKFVSTYKDVREQTEESKVWLQIRQQYKGEVINGAIMVIANFYIQRPNAHFRTGKNAGILKKNAPRYPLSRPDIDNYLKFYMDCLNEVVWSDDCQIIAIHSCKVYADGKPKTEIIITRVTND